MSKGTRVLRARWIGLAALVAAGALAGCGSSGDSTAATTTKASVQPPAAIKSAGKIVYCTDPTYPPAEFQSAGQFEGSDIELGKAIADTMGVGSDFTVVGFDGIIPAVQAGKCDAVLAAMSVTPDRSKAVTFIPYVAGGQGIMVQAGNPKQIKSFDDLAGTYVSVLVGTTNKQKLDALNKQFAAGGKPQIHIVIFNKDSDAANALATKKVDAYESDYASVAWYAKKNPKLFTAVDAVVPAEPWGIAIQKSATDLQKALQAAVDKLYADGTMQKILAKWGLAKLALHG